MARQYIAVIGAVSLILCLQLSSVQAAPTTTLQQPNWAELSPQQKQILAPLANDWDGLESYRRKNWLGIAQRYPTMPPEQQQRVSAKMKAWAAMTPHERNLAREKFKKLNKVPPEQRAARREKWEQYRALPEPEKKKLREVAAKKRLHKRAEVHAATKPSPSLPKGNLVPKDLNPGQRPDPLTQKTPAASIAPAVSGSAATK
jgi:Protein of unknown function (DUF3106)